MNWIIEQLLRFTGSQKFLTLQLDITSKCNLRCAHCYHSVGEERMDLAFDQWIGILKQYDSLANKLHLKPCFIISGGEPTCSSLFIPLLRYLRSQWRGAHIVLLTNATDIPDAAMEEIASSIATVQVSIDGPDSSRHDMVRGNGTFVRALEGISKLQAAGVSVSLQAILSYRTAPWIPEFFHLANSKDISEIDFTRFITQGNGAILAASGMDRPLLPRELESAYGAILRSSSETSIATNTNLPLFCLLQSDLGANGKVGFQGLVIDFRGNLKVTSRTDFLLGNVLDQGLEKLFLAHPVMNALRKGEILGCGSCKFYDRCGGDRNAAFAAYGNFLAKDPACWL